MEEYSLSAGNLCRRCGRQTGTLALVCMACVAREYLAEQLARSLEQLAAYPHARLETARERDASLHLALLNDPWLAWCGAVLRQPRSRRAAYLRHCLPPGVCRNCLEVLGAGTEAAERVDGSARRA